MNMSTEGNQGAGASGEGTSENDVPKRDIESYAAEMNRKTEKLSQENSKLSQQLEQLMAIVSQQQRTAAPSASSSQIDESKELEDLVYTNPKEYARRVTDKATKAALSTVNATIQQQQQANNVLTQLVGEYPELADNSSELTQKAVNAYKSMSEAERSSPLAYKTAVRDAAAELGLLPKTKRSAKSDGEESVNLGSKSSAANDLNRQSTKQQKAGKLDEKTLEIAKLMGLDVSKKEVVERLAKRNERKNWGKYE